MTMRPHSLKRDESSSRFRLLFEHDLFGKPLHTFPDHALTRTLGSGITPQATFPSFCAFPCLGLPEPRCYQRPTPRPPRPKTSAHASVAYHQQAPHFRRIFIMTQVDHTRMANAIRGLAMDAVEKAKSGHPGLPMGAADVAT